MNTNSSTLSKRSLGGTDIKVTPIGLGGNKFSGGKGVYGMMMPDLSQEQVNGIIKTALDGGINWFDTAEIYGFGHSEQGIANALIAAEIQDDGVIVATKWNPILRSAGNISKTIDKRLHFLGGYHIDLYMVHFPWGFSSPEAEMDAMADLVEAGKISSIGVSNFSAKQMRRAHAALEKRGLHLAVNQVQYSLLYRNIETNGVLDAAQELGVTIIAWGPLASGLLTGKFHKDPAVFEQTPFARRISLKRNIERSRPMIEKLDEVAARYDVSPSQVAVNWLVNFHGETVVAIPGASKAEHARQSAGAMKFRLSDDDMALLDEISRRY